MHHNTAEGLHSFVNSLAPLHHYTTGSYYMMSNTCPHNTESRRVNLLPLYGFPCLRYEHQRITCKTFQSCHINVSLYLLLGRHTGTILGHQVALYTLYSLKELILLHLEAKNVLPRLNTAPNTRDCCHFYNCLEYKSCH